MNKKERLDFIYVIKVFEKLELDELGYPDLGCTHRWGSFDNFEDAENVVKNNITDIWETCYDYARIAEEEFNCVCPAHTQEWYYKYDRETNTYNRIERPNELEHYMI